MGLLTYNHNKFAKRESQTHPNPLWKTYTNAKLVLMQKYYFEWESHILL